MRVFKFVDIVGQIFIYLIVLISLIGIVNDQQQGIDDPADGFLPAVGLAVIGSWQACSALIHLFMTRYYITSRLRTRYWQSIGVLVLVLPVCIGIDFDGAGIVVSVALSGLAVLYSVTSFVEFEILNRRKLIHLK